MWLIPSYCAFFVVYLKVLLIGIALPELHGRKGFDNFLSLHYCAVIIFSSFRMITNEWVQLITEFTSPPAAELDDPGPVQNSPQKRVYFRELRKRNDIESTSSHPFSPNLGLEHCRGAAAESRGEYLRFYSMPNTTDNHNFEPMPMLAIPILLMNPIFFSCIKMLSHFD